MSKDRCSFDLIRRRLNSGFKLMLRTRLVVAVLLVCSAVLFIDTPARAASIVAKVDLSSQRMQVYLNGKKTYSWRVSTGKAGWRTPTGSYSPLVTYRNYYSKKWGMNMPYLVLISRGGIAIHGTHATGKLGRTASHGCIRLHPSNAAKFYGLVRKYGKSSTRVIVSQ